VRYFSEDETRDALVELNDRLLAHLSAAGLAEESVIYVSVHDPGSSSHVMLNLLRDAALLERRGCRFLDWRDTMRLHTLTNELEQGAIVYVDDFAGTGHQFCRSRNFAAEYFVGTFAEYFLLPCICEEAAMMIQSCGVEPRYAHLHTQTERPLHNASNMLRRDAKTRLLDLCRTVHGHGGSGLGYGELATAVVFYRNAPNTVPLLLRGNISQNRYVGVLPRTTDLSAR
jgi:hypothetical protein